MTDTTQPRKPANLPSTLWRIRFPDGSVATLEGEPADYMKPYATAYHIPRQAAPEAPTGELIHQLRSITGHGEWQQTDADGATIIKRMPHWGDLYEFRTLQVVASTGAAPEAPTCTGCDPAEGFCRACRDAEQRSIAATTAGAPPTDFTIVDGGRTIVTGLLGSSNRDEPVRIFKEVIPASASGEDFYLASDGVEHSHPAYGQGVFFTHDCCRATAPSPDAAPLDDATAFDAAIQSGALIWDHKATARAIAYEGFKAGRAALAQQSAAQAAHAGAMAEKPETVDIEREGAKFWHMNCTNHFGGVMREKVREADKSLIECLSCGKCGYYPVGRAGLVRAAMSAATEQGNKNG